jgi:long-subunit fatty acid transport protein
MKAKRSLFLSFLGLFLVIVSSDLSAFVIYQDVKFASSPNPVGSGARALGMGGAFIAVADDATAASWNPACLVHLERPELSVVGDYIAREIDLDSSAHPERNSTAEADDLKVNYLSASYPFVLFKRNMVVSLNYQRLYDFNLDLGYHYDASVPAGPGFIVTSEDRGYVQDGNLGALGVALAVEITPRLSLGLTVNIWTDDLWWKNGWDETYTSRGISYHTVFGGLQSTDVVASERYSDFGGENANIGLLWNIDDRFSLGAVFKTPFTAKFHRERSESSVIRNAGGVVVGGSASTLTEDVRLRMPMSYGLGFACRFSDAFTMDLDVYRTDWSEFILTDSQGNRRSGIDGRPAEEADIQDTTQVRVGAEYLVIRPDHNLVVPIRAGAFYDPEPGQGKVKDFYGFTLGGGIAYKGFVFDLAYQYRWSKNEDGSDLVPDSRADAEQHSLLGSIIIHF